MCDQEDETVQHMLTTRVLAREFWLRILTPLGLQDRTPTILEKIIGTLVAKNDQENSEKEEEGFEHNYHSRLLDPLEASKRLCKHRRRS